MRTLKQFLIVTLLLLWQGHWMAGIPQESIELSVQAPKVVTVGEVFRLAYSINAKADNFNGPKIDGFLFNGPMLSTSMSTQIINNQVSQTVSYTYNYTLQATTEGIFTIPSASASFKGKTYTCAPVRIEVLKAGASGNQQQGGQSGESQSGLSNEDLFVRIEVDRTQVYKGEQILAVIKVYTRVNLARFGEMKIPDFSGFWNQEIDVPGQVSLERVNYNGKLYNVGVLKKSILIPQQTGRIVIDPFQIECFVNVQSRRQRSPFDDFFGDNFFGSYETVSKKISSAPVEINVKPFPAGQPEGFTGAAGKFSVTATLDTPSVMTNEPVTLKVTVKGSGNIKLIELPAFRFPGDLEIYDPKITDQVDAGNNGVTGSKTFEYLIVPRHAGSFEIPVWTFSWFDPTNGTYQSYSAGPMTLTVEKGANDNEATIISTPGKEDIKVIGQDIRFIKSDNTKFSKASRYFFGSAGFWLALISIFLISALVLFYFWNQFRNQTDIEGSRFRKAIAVSRKQLEKARVSLETGHSEVFLEALTRGLFGYISNKFNLGQIDLNRDNIKILLAQKGLEETIISGLMKTIDSVEFLRYAPPSGEADFRSLLAEAEDIIVRIEKTYRR